jgi:4-aminobutyrate aminotransferase-like enzyme
MSASARQEKPAAAGAEHFASNTRPIYPPLVSGQGARIEDADGNTFIDCAAQTLNMNLGQSHPSVLEAVQEQLRRLTYASTRYSSDVAYRLHDRLIELLPEGLEKINMTSVIGSAANECALKAARSRTGREQVISRIGSHLGQTTEAMRVSGKHWERSYLGERRTHFLPAPYCYRCPFGQTPDTCSVECLDELETLVRADDHDVAAAIVEPIMVDAGVLTPPQKYHRRLREICDDREIPLIFDEIQTGFGWLGVMFAMELIDTTPDLVSLGKGLGAGFPIAATAFKPEYDVLSYGEHEMTSGAHVLSCAASLAMIDYLQAPGTLEAIAAKGRAAREVIDSATAAHPSIGDVRGHGLLLGIEVIDPSDGAADPVGASRLATALRQRGVMLRLSGVGVASNVLQFKPPVVITEDEIAEVAYALGKSLEEQAL